MPLLFVRLLFAAGLLSCGSVQAALAMDYCSPYTKDGKPHPDGLSVNDVTFGLAGGAAKPADDCWGVEQKNDKQSLLLPSLWADATAGPWEELIKDDNTGTGESDSDGTVWRQILWTLDAVRTSGTETTGDYRLTWIEQVASALPSSFDLMVVLKGGSAWAGYLFDNLSFASDGSGSGLFRIGWCGDNSAGGAAKEKSTKKTTASQTDDEKCNGNGFSHMTIYARSGAPSIPERPERPQGFVPVPGTLALLAVGLLGLGRFGRGSRKA
jgi:hypothetical protein